jgi:hypothetical protein
MPLQNKIANLSTQKWSLPPLAEPESRNPEHLRKREADLTLTAYNSTDASLDAESPSKARVRFQTAVTLGTSKFLLQTNAYGAEPLCSLTVDALKDIARRVDEAYMTGKYRSVLNKAEWRTMFQVSQRSVNRIEGTTLTSTPQDTMPCYKCGLVLPLDHITIDHHKPQAGGEHAAVLKVLRNIAVGLTAAPGHGGVATAFRTGQFQPLPTKASRGSDEVNMNRPEGRYTLTPKGILFLSVAVAASSPNDVTRYCMHSLFNLKPYCFKCNILKSNRLTDLSWINTGV